MKLLVTILLFVNLLIQSSFGLDKKKLERKREILVKLEPLQEEMEDEFEMSAEEQKKLDQFLQDNQFSFSMSMVPSTTPSLNPTQHPTNLPSEMNNLCPINEFLGRTYVAPFGKTNCLKFELFTGGSLIVDNANPNCGNAEFNAVMNMSKFDYGSGSQAYFVSTGKGFSGTLNFHQDSSYSNPVLIPNVMDDGVFDADFYFPTCYQGPTYPCPSTSFENKTIYITIPSYGCLKAQLFDSGHVSLDDSDADCSTSVHTGPNLSEFDYIRGNSAYFKKIAGKGYSGEIQFSDNSAVTELKVKPSLDGNTKHFVLRLTYPSCVNI